MKSASSDEDDSSPMRAAASILASAANNNVKQGNDVDPAERKETPSDGGPTGPLAETVTHERRWETMFERLKKFKVRVVFLIGTTTGINSPLDLTVPTD